MAKLYLVNDKNKTRKWSFQLANGNVVTLHANRWIESDEDLSEYVRSGFVSFRDTGSAPAPAEPPVAPVVAPVAVSVPSDSVSAFAVALGNAFAKPAPAPAPEPVPVPVPVPVVEDVEPAAEDAQSVAYDYAADDTKEAYASMTRNALWVLASERGLVSGLDYRSTTKTQLVNLLAANLEG